MAEQCRARASGYIVIDGAMNKGADRATAEYIYFLNSGETLLPHTLRTLFGTYGLWKGSDGAPEGISIQQHVSSGR